MTSKHSIGHFHWIVLKHFSRHNTERYVDGVEVAIDCKTTGRRLVHWASSLLIISACGLQDAGSIGRTAGEQLCRPLPKGMCIRLGQANVRALDFHLYH